MSDNGTANFTYLAGDGTWPLFKWRGLERRADGVLQLASLPLLEGEAPAELPKPDGPAGVAVDYDGTIFFTDPANHRVMRIDGCDGALRPAPCMGGAGNVPAEFNSPRGLLIAAHRRSLFVADSGNHRVQVFDLRSMQVVDIWGQPSVADAPRAGKEPGRFDTPVALAGDGEGNVYVVDAGNRRVRKFNRAGVVVAAFWETMASAGLIERPIDIAVHSEGETALIYVLDEERRAVLVFDAEGEVVRGDEGGPRMIGAGVLREPLGLAVTSEAVYVGERSSGELWKFARKNGEKIGAAVNFQGPVAALAVDGKGGLLAHAGLDSGPLRLVIGGGYLRRGVLWSRAIQPRDFPVRWHALKAEVAMRGAEARARFFIHTSDRKTDAPIVALDDEDPFADPRWRPRDEAANLTDLFIGGAPGRFLWVGALLAGDGRSTPVVSQARVDFDHDDYRRHLPEIYRDQSSCGDFLPRFLSLFESMFGDVEERIADLARLFDPAAAPKEFLPWLAGWLALQLDETWSEEEQRRAIAEAFASYGRRGTREGLQERLRALAGVHAIVEEPVAALWVMPEEDVPCGCRESAKREAKRWRATEYSILGVTTGLAPASPDGAVLGSTATLGASHLIDGEAFGAPLFEDVAHRFSVQVYRSELTCPETLPRLRAVIEQEKPAHTTYHLCVIEPAMRVGFQARVGIDAVVGGPLPATALGNGSVIGGELAGRVGDSARLGLTARVG